MNFAARFLASCKRQRYFGNNACSGEVGLSTSKVLHKRVGKTNHLILNSTGIKFEIRNATLIIPFSGLDR